MPQLGLCPYLLLLLFGFSRDRVSLYSPGCPGAHFVDQAGLELRNPPASASRVLGLKACATTPGSYLLLDGICVPSTRRLFELLYGIFAIHIETTLNFFNTVCGIHMGTILTFFFFFNAFLPQTLWVPLSVWNGSLGQVDKASVGDRPTHEIV